MKKAKFFYLIALLTLYITMNICCKITVYATDRSYNDNSNKMKFINISMVTSNIGYAITKNFSVVKTSDGGDTWRNILAMNSLFEFNDEPGLIAVNKDTVYVAAYSSTGINIYKTANSGKIWSTSSIHMKVDDPSSGYGGNIIMSFINKTKGFLITNSLPAAGLMSKALYRTTDGGKSWSSDNLKGIQGYTTGMNFNHNSTGYITCSYHGQKKISIYCRREGKKDWKIVSVTVPEKYKLLACGKNYYVDVYSASMFMKNSQEEKMELYFCKGNEKNIYLYISKDNGTTWVIDGISNRLMKKFCFIDNKKGFGIDEYGNSYITHDGGLTWKSRDKPYYNKALANKSTLLRANKTGKDNIAGNKNNFESNRKTHNINVKNMKVIASIPKEKIYFYASNKIIKGNMYKGLVLGIHGTNKSFDWGTSIEDLPELYYIDLNHDQKKELVILLSKGFGTGYVNKSIHIINPDDFTEYKVEDSQSIIKNHVKTKKLSAKKVELTIDNKKIYVDTRKFSSKVLGVYPEKIEKIVCGVDYIDYYNYKNTIKGYLGVEGDYLKYIGDITFTYTFKDNQFKASNIQFEALE